jgi:serine/threonine-protein kinase
LFDENDVIAKRYRLLRQLGAEGMGVVWEAHDEQLDRSVALKAIVPKLARDPKKLARFETGAKAVAALSSPHIVQLLEYGVDKAPYMVMELLHGSVLTERVSKGDRFDLDMAVRIIVQTAKALTTAHDAGVVHRNLKLGNIFLVDDGDDEFVKVFDFGTAKWLTGFRNANDITTMGSIMGNPDYLAPEQLSGDARSDDRADVWSLAAIAYHLITGVTPFEGEQMGAIILSILFTDPEPPSKIDPSLPPALDELFSKALSKKRDERFQSAREFSDALCDAVGTDGATLRISVRSKDSGTPSLGDIDSADELPETKFEGAATPAPQSGPVAESSEAPDSEAPNSSAGPGPSLDTPSAAALVRPMLSKPSTLDLPPLPVLAIGAAVFLGLGGGAAWFVMSAPNETGGGDTTPSGALSSSSTGVDVSTGTAGDSSSSDVIPKPSSAPTGTTKGSAGPGSPTPSAAPSTALSTDPAASASASAPRPSWPTPRHDPEDIYE